MPAETAPSHVHKEEVGYVDALGCLEALWPDPRSRPCLRWFKSLQADGLIPYRKIRQRVFYDVAEVRRSLDQHCRK